MFAYRMITGDLLIEPPGRLARIMLAAPGSRKEGTVMNERLMEAVKAGLAEREKEDRQNQAIKKALEEEKRIAYQQALEKARYLVRTDYLYAKVREAVKADPNATSFRLGTADSSPAMTEAINEIEGFRATYSTGEAHINSDEVMETWERVEVYFLTKCILSAGRPPSP